MRGPRAGIVILVAATCVSAARASGGEDATRRDAGAETGASSGEAHGPAKAAAPSDIAPPAELATAIRTWFDAAEQGAGALRALHERYPADDDVSYWLATSMALTAPDEALALLNGAAPGRVPPYRVHWTRAQAWAARIERRTEHPGDAQRASDLSSGRVEMAAVWSGASFPRDPEWADMVSLATWFDVQSGRSAEAAARLRENGGAAGPYAVWAWSEGVHPTPLRVEMGGRRFVVDRLGLVAPDSAGAEGTEVREGPGPDLIGPDGRPCFPAPATRSDPAPDGTGWLYVAGSDAPEGTGIFHIERCGARPSRLVADPALSSPARHGKALAYVKDGRVVEEGAPSLTDDAGVVRIASAGDLLVRVTMAHGEMHLRCDDRLCFTEDPPVTRAGPAPSPTGPPSREAPPLPRARPR